MVWVEVVVWLGLMFVAVEVDSTFAWYTWRAGRVATCSGDVVAVAAGVHRRHRDSCHTERTEEEDHGTFVVAVEVEAVVVATHSVVRAVADFANHCCMDSECYCCCCLVETCSI